MAGLASIDSDRIDASLNQNIGFAPPRKKAGDPMSIKMVLAAGLSATMLLPWAASAQGDAEAGKTKNSMCIGCHEIPGYKSSFPSVYHVPMIVGQSAKYIESALQAYRKGERSHPTMTAVAASLSDQDIADLAAYYGTK